MLAALAGLLVGGVLAGLLMAAWSPDDDVITGDVAAERFIEAWERSKRGTFRVLSESRRTSDDGRELVSSIELVQRPPDFLRRGFGSVEARIGDRPIGCTTDPAGELHCTAGEGERTYEEIVEEEVGRWDAYFEGEVPLYRIETGGDGCFDLYLTRTYPSPPYGRFARFCFDDETGARTYTEVRKDEGTDVVEALEVSARVTDADFELPR